MNTKIMKIAAALLVSALSYNAYAETDGRLPGKTGDIDSATDKTASCLVKVQTLDLKEIMIHTTFKVDMPLIADGRRLQAKKTLTVGNNYQVAVNVTVVPGRSFNYKGKDLLILESSLQRIEANDQKTVLTTIMTSSDNQFSEPTDKFVFAEVNIDNPEIATVAINQKTPMSAYALLEAGLIPNGSLSDVTVNCVTTSNQKLSERP